MENLINQSSSFELIFVNRILLDIHDIRMFKERTICN